MSKAARYREANAAKKQLKMEQEVKAARKAKATKLIGIIALVLVFALVIGMIGGAIINSIKVNSGSEIRALTVAKTDNHSVNGAEYSYLYHYYMNLYASQYGADYAQYFASSVATTVQDTFTEHLAYLELADENGLKVTDAEAAMLDTYCNRYFKLAAKNAFGRGVKESDMRSFKDKEFLAYKYLLEKQKELIPTVEELEKKLADAEAKDETKNNYKKIDFVSMVLSYGDSAKLTKEEATAFADRMKSSTDKESFLAVAKEVYAKTYPDLDEATLATYLDNLSSTGVSYKAISDTSADGIPLLEWAFADEITDKTLKVADDEGSKISVYLLTKEPYLDVDPTVTLRTVYFSNQIQGSADKAKKAAEDIKKKYEANPTEENFGLLAVGYTDMTNYYTGGLMRYISESTVSANYSEDMAKWAFDASRKAGDIAVFELKDGVCLTYFAETGLLEWQSELADEIVSEKITSMSDEAKKAHPVTLDQDAINRVLELG